MISVIMPTYNRADMLERSLRSVMNQTRRDIEAIVVDDGSTDNTGEVVARLAAASPVPIKYLRKSNGGCASARNMGIKSASGEIISFLDSDDEFVPDAMETLAAVLERTGADFVYSPLIYVFEDGTERASFPAAASRPESFAAEHFKRTDASITAAIFRKTVFDRAGRMDEEMRYNEDSDFFQRAGITCRAAYSGTPSVRVHIHGTNKSDNKVELYRALLNSTQKVLADYPEFAKSLGADAEKRICEIKSDLAAALIASGQLDEARRVAAGEECRMRIMVRLSLATGSSFPLTVEHIFQAIKYRVGRLWS